MELMALFQLHFFFLHNACSGEDGPRSGHLCHFDKFIVFLFFSSIKISIFDIVFQNFKSEFYYPRCFHEALIERVFS